MHWLLVPLLALAPLALAPRPARAVAATSGTQVTPDCGGNAGGAPCAANEDRVATPAATATATPTPTRASNGADCTTPSQCASGFCVDDVCCDTACDGPAESCSQSGERGTCASLHAPAPPLSRKGLFSVIALLTAAGVLFFARRRRLGAAATHEAGC
jgi:hypothetical protein